MGLVAPRKVRNFARDVAEVIGAEPEIEHLPPGLWRVTLTGDRVTASADFKASPSGVRYLSGALSIDGRPRPAVTPQELRQLWDKYERHAGLTAPAALGPIPDHPQGRTLPAEVRQIRDLLARSLGEDAVKTGFAGGRWIVGADSPGGDGIRLTFVRALHGRWDLAEEQPMRVVAGGKDRSAQAGRDITAALASLTQAHPDPGNPAAVAARPARGTRDNGIETRRMVVIRELTKRTHAPGARAP